MNIYRVFIDSDKYLMFATKRPSQVDQLLFDGSLHTLVDRTKQPEPLKQVTRRPIGKPFGSEWDPIDLCDYPIDDEAYVPNAIAGDFFSSSAVNFGLTQHARDVAEDWFLEYGQLLPLTYNGKYDGKVMFHCTTVIDALDEKRSNSLWRDFMFFPEKLTGAELFQCPNWAGLFCTDTFKQKIEGAGLIGLDFDLTFSDEPAGIARIDAWRLKCYGTATPPHLLET
jgi:hypothetical protein